MWFCKSARVSRSIVFQRIASIEKLTGIGFSLDDAYQIILTKPYAIRETLNEVGEWSHGELTAVAPDVAVRLAVLTTADVGCGAGRCGSQ
jgi:hypothetical protein